MKLAKLNSLPKNDALFEGAEPDETYKIRQHIIVEDTYNFTTNNATDVTSIDDWHKYAPRHIGHVENFMDWKVLRDKVKELIVAKAGADLSTYVTALTASEKQCAVLYIPTTIVGFLGYDQLVTDAGSDDKAKNAIKDYIERASAARMNRYHEVIVYGYKRLGKGNGIAVENDIEQIGLHNNYVKRGNLTKAEDTVDGLEDYYRSDDSFTAAGVLVKLNDSTYTLIDDESGQTPQQFVDKSVDIMKSGAY